MAWATPKTWSIGQLVSANDLNEQIRDNFTHLKIPVGDDGKIPAISATYFTSLSGANLTGVAKTATDTTYTAGKQNYNGGATTRFVLPVGADRWAV